MDVADVGERVDGYDQGSINEALDDVRVRLEPGPKSGAGNMFRKSCPGPGDAYPLEEE